MTRVRFWGEAEVISGGGVPVRPLLYLVVAIAVEAFIAAYVWVIALVLGLLLGAMTAAVIILRRCNPDDAEALARQAAALHAEVAAERQHAAPKALTIVNVQPGAHVHLTPGETVAGHIAPPVPGEVTGKENPSWHNYRR